MSDDDELAKLKEEVAALRKRIDPEPRPRSTWAPRDYTEGMSMDRSAMQAMIDAVPDRLMRDLRADALKPNPVTVSRTDPQPQPVKRGTGWINERKLEPPPGIAHCDRMMDEQDRLDRAELALRLAKAE